MAFGGGGGGSGSIAGSSDVLLSSLANSQVLAYNSASSKWNNQTPSGGGGGVPTTYALGRVKYAAGWPGARPTGYAYIDWIKSGATDPDPAAGIMIAGDTISEWQ